MKRTVPTVKWLLEEGTFSEDITPIVEEIRNQEMIVELTKYKPFESGEYNQFSPDDCVIVLGSINLVRQIQRQKPWIPGSFANFHNFNCLTYYAHYGKYLFNQDYIILPLSELQRRYEQICRYFLAGRLFIRPCDGTKSFTGQILENPKELDAYGKPELPVVVSSAKNIGSEFRIFCSKDKIIAGSRYRNNAGELQYTQITNQMYGVWLHDTQISNAVYLANQILKETEWKPDSIFAMDIGFENNEVKAGLLEINSFSCSGQYATHPAPIVAEAARLARLEWEEINNL